MHLLEECFERALAVNIHGVIGGEDSVCVGLDLGQEALTGGWGEGIIDHGIAVPHQGLRSATPGHPRGHMFY